LSTIKQLLDKGILQMLQLLDLVKTRYVAQEEVDELDPAHLSFFNINTQNDVINAEKLMRCEERHATNGKGPSHNAQC